MDSKLFSLIVRYWRDRKSGVTQFEIVRIETDKVVTIVPPEQGSFLILLASDRTTQVERCLIRHLSSGREISIQSGSGLQAFIKACLVDDTENTSLDS